MSAMTPTPDKLVQKWRTGDGYGQHHKDGLLRAADELESTLRALSPQPELVEAFVRGYKHGACHYIGGDNTEELDAAARWAAENQSDDAGVFATPQPEEEDYCACTEAPCEHELARRAAEHKPSLQEIFRECTKEN